MPHDQLGIILWLLQHFLRPKAKNGPSLLFQLGIAMTGAQKTAILSTFEPLTSIVLGVVCFGEAVGIKTGIGVAFILASVISITLFGRKNA